MPVELEGFTALSLSFVYGRVFWNGTVQGIRQENLSEASSLVPGTQQVLRLA